MGSSRPARAGGAIDIPGFGPGRAPRGKTFGTISAEVFSFASVGPEPRRSHARSAGRAAVGERAVSAELTPWIVFLVAVAALLAIDLGVLGRRGGVMSTKTALLWSAMWIGLGLSFSLAVWGWRGADGRPGVPGRLPHRGVAEHRQPLRLPARLRLPRHRPAATSARCSSGASSGRSSCAACSSSPAWPCSSASPG